MKLAEASNYGAPYCILGTSKSTHDHSAEHTHLTSRTSRANDWAAAAPVWSCFEGKNGSERVQNASRF